MPLAEFTIGLRDEGTKHPYQYTKMGNLISERAMKGKGTVGIVGLGIMGGAFAKHLVDAGWRVIGYDIDKARCRALTRAGVEIAKDVSALATAFRALSPPGSKQFPPGTSATPA